ncbi:MAG: M48 family metalloprotease [Brucellaceae bacterium]|nr:M48 family metalloprotease [Brucellaceae bacterium]
MARRGLLAWVRAGGFALTLGLGLTPAGAGALPDYPQSELAEWQQRYPRGILANYREVILPRLDEADRAKLAGLRFEFPLSIPSREPYAYAADTQGRTIYMSVQSLKFFDELSIAMAWLDRSGFAVQSALNYLTVLRHWDRAGSPPRPFEAMCVPDDVLDNTDVDSLSQKMFATAIFFVMVHEIGHVVHAHGGYEGISREEARRREEEADAFALKVLARTGDLPLGVVTLFLSMTYLQESRTDFSSDQAHQLALAARTHPLSAERLTTFAGQLSEEARNFTDSGLSPVAIAAVAGQVLQVATLSLEIERLTALTAPTLTPADLGPMRPGDLLARSCQPLEGTGQPFAGRMKGTVTVDSEDWDIDAELSRTGDRVTGRSSYGVGISRLEGFVDGNTLHYRWQLGEDTGRGVLTRIGESYVGTWGEGESEADGGTLQLKLQ